MYYPTFPQEQTPTPGGGSSALTGRVERRDVTEDIQHDWTHLNGGACNNQLQPQSEHLHQSARSTRSLWNLFEITTQWFSADPKPNVAQTIETENDACECRVCVHSLCGPTLLLFCGVFSQTIVTSEAESQDLFCGFALDSLPWIFKPLLLVYCLVWFKVNLNIKEEQVNEGNDKDLYI